MSEVDAALSEVDAALAKSFREAVALRGWTAGEIDETLVELTREMRRRRKERSEMHG